MSWMIILACQHYRLLAAAMDKYTCQIPPISVCRIVVKHNWVSQNWLIGSFRFARRMTSGTVKTSDVASSPQRLLGSLRVVDLRRPTDDKYDAWAHEWNWHSTRPRIIRCENRSLLMNELEIHNYFLHRCSLILQPQTGYLILHRYTKRVVHQGTQVKYPECTQSCMLTAKRGIWLCMIKLFARWNQVLTTLAQWYQKVHQNSTHQVCL